MTKLETYKCDRCGKEFNLPQGHVPVSWTRKEGENEQTYDLCGECAEVLDFTMVEMFVKSVNSAVQQRLEEIAKLEEESKN